MEKWDGKRIQVIVEILKKRFPNLTTEDTMRIAIDILVAVDAVVPEI